MKQNKKIIALAIVAILLVSAVGAIYALGGFNGNAGSDVIDDDSGTNETTSGPITITQSDGTTVTLDGVADRIVVLNVNSAEMLYLLGAGDRVVGSSSATLTRAEGPQMFPNAVDVGSSTTPDTEKLATLNADVIIAFSTMKLKNQDAVESLGVKVVYIDCYIMGDIERDVRSLAKIVGDTEKGEKYISYVDSYMSLIKDRIKGVSSADYPSTYVEFTTDYNGQCNGTSSDVILSMVGGINICHDLAYGSTVSREWIVSQNPEFMFKIQKPEVIGNETNATGAFSAFAGREGFSSISAVADGHTYLIRNELCYGPRGFVSGLIFAKAFYPTLFSDIDINKVLEDYNSEFNTTFDTNVTTYPALGSP
jgi:iron complex transport system substrate-binding protein